MGIDFEQLATVFNQWAQNYVELKEAEWCGIDGKSIKGTVQDYDKGCQNFISLRIAVKGFESHEQKKVRILA